MTAVELKSELRKRERERVSENGVVVQASHLITTHLSLALSLSLMVCVCIKFHCSMAMSVQRLHQIRTHPMKSPSSSLKPITTDIPNVVLLINQN